MTILNILTIPDPRLKHKSSDVEVFDEKLKKIVGDTAYNNWLKQLSFISNKENTITLSVPTKFLRDWIVNNYSDIIKTESKKYIDKIEIIKFVVKPNGGRIVPGTTRTIKNTD